MKGTGKISGQNGVRGNNMENKDLISIVVPVYNAAAYLAETITMVIRQTYPEWELLLVDDCSTDESAEVIHRTVAEYTASDPQIGDRIRLIRKEKNEGAALARNTGIREAKGRYLAFLDADDVWLPDKLLKELTFMKEKDAAFVFCSYEFGDEDAVPTGKVVHAPEMLTYRKALSRTVIFTTTVLFDLEKTGREPVMMPDVKSEDTATWWKVLKAGFPAYGLDEVLAIYRRPKKSLSSNKLEAVRRIWSLYRRQENLSLPDSIVQLFFWAVRATLRRL